MLKYYNEFSEELRKVSAEIANMKTKLSKMEDGPEKGKLRQ